MANIKKKNSKYVVLWRESNTFAGYSYTYNGKRIA